MPETFDLSSMAFHAACNQAVDASIRPIRRRVLRRLAERFRFDGRLLRLLSDTQSQADNEIPAHPVVSWRGKLVENRFIELIASDPQWKTIVLDAVVQERRWSDIWSRGYEIFLDRLVSLLEKLISPDHPTARLTTRTLTSGAAILEDAPHLVES
jgi:hypothetical protein